jgi:hypothetical protein
MAIVKLNKLQRMSENMSQLLSNETHMPKNLYQTSSENSYRYESSSFSFLHNQKWQQKRLAEPEVQAVHPHRHLPSGRKSRLRPSLRPSPAEPFCLLPDGSICPRISGFIRS